jgi:hypothetical protein
MGWDDIMEICFFGMRYMHVDYLGCFVSRSMGSLLHAEIERRAGDGMRFDNLRLRIYSENL